MRKDYFDTKENQIQIWVLPIQQIPQEIYPDLLLFLTVEERTIWSKFFFEKDQNRYLLTRVLIRQILSAYLDRPPLDIVFATNLYGRPYVPELPKKLDFNLSHTKDLIICGMVGDGKIGVDTEKTNRRVEFGIAKRFFSVLEQNDLKDLSDEEKVAHFWRIWTLKEAYIKAIGKGLTLPLDSFGFYNFAEQKCTLWQSSPEKLEHCYFYSFFSIFDHRIACLWSPSKPAEVQPRISIQTYLPLFPPKIEDIDWQVAFSGFV